MGRTAVEKIAALHRADGRFAPVSAGEFVSIRPRHVLTHDNTAAVLTKFRAMGGTRVRDPRQPVFALDHDVQNTSESNLAKYRRIEEFAREQGIDFHPAGEGIGHQLMVERGYVVPGSFAVASDSHANTYGALGALGTPVVRTDAAAIWATGELWWQVPPTTQVVLDGELRDGATGKDVVLALCGLYPREVLNHAVEFAGPGVAALDVDARLAIANMTTEWGARAGWFPPDERTAAWLRRRRDVLLASDIERLTAADADGWLADPPGPDPDARYAARIVLDLAEVAPHVAGPDAVHVTAPLAELEERGVPIDKAYLVSCANSRHDDLAAAAEVLRGRRVAPDVELYLAAASREVQERAEASGVWRILLEAGARPLPPGCGPCIGLGAGLLRPGEVGISSTNRNFQGRMGSREARCYLASPAVVAASAAAGRIAGTAPAARRVPERRHEALDGADRAPGARVEFLDGFPERVRGRLVLVPRDGLDTDGIYGKDHTYRDDVTPEEMARVAMENHDPAFASLARAGDVLVGGFRFGAGSSREQAVTCLQAIGIPCVVAGSFDQTYLRNAFNNGLPCLESSALVRHLQERFADRARAGERTIVPGEVVEVDFRSSRVRLGRRSFPFPPLSGVAQSLVVAGGIEGVVRRRLELEAPVH